MFDGTRGGGSDTAKSPRARTVSAHGQRLVVAHVRLGEARVEGQLLDRRQVEGAGRVFAEPGQLEA